MLWTHPVSDAKCQVRALQPHVLAPKVTAHACANTQEQLQRHKQKTKAAHISKCKWRGCVMKESGL